MNISVPFQDNGINTEDLEKLAKANPQYTKLFIAFAQIDSFVKQVCRDTVCNTDDPNLYSIKTEIASNAYSLYLYNIERNAIVGTTWPITSFLALCQSKTIESDVRTQTQRIIKFFGEPDLMEGTAVNWV